MFLFIYTSVEVITEKISKGLQYYIYMFIKKLNCIFYFWNFFILYTKKHIQGWLYTYTTHRKCLRFTFVNFWYDTIRYDTIYVIELIWNNELTWVWGTAEAADGWYCWGCWDCSWAWGLYKGAEYWPWGWGVNSRTTRSSFAGGQATRL